MSAESGVPTFRGAGGLWRKHRATDLATPEAFARDPALVYDFYNHRRQVLRSVQPNAGHRALAELERLAPFAVTLITQNVDDLHERAGSLDLIHMHGELLKARCMACASVHDWPENLDTGSVCPHCARAAQLRPHVVWFGEMPLQLNRIQSVLEQCDLFIAVGTSGQVYPAAGFVNIARAHDACTIEVNIEDSDISPLFHRRVRASAAEALPALAAELLDNG